MLYDSKKDSYFSVISPPRTPSQITVLINYLPANKVPCCLSISSCVLTSLALTDLLLLGVITKVCVFINDFPSSSFQSVYTGGRTLV